MELVSAIQRAILTFVSACNRSGYRPLAEEVEGWLSDPDPEEAVYRTETVTPRAPEPLTGAVERMLQGMMSEHIASSLSPLKSSMFGDGLRVKALAAANTRLLSAARYPRTRRVLVTPAESPVAHLVRIGWLEAVEAGEEDRLRVTDLGSALLRAAERDAEEDPDVGLVVLDREDPLAYARLVGRLHEVGAGLLVDPYLEIDALHHLVTSTRLSRVLVLGSTRNGARLGAITAYLSGRLSRPIEVRSSPELHDRVVISEESEVLTIGTSINGLHKHTTMIVPVPDAGARALVDYYESLWSGAKSLNGKDAPADDPDPK